MALTQSSGLNDILLVTRAKVIKEGFMPRRSEKEMAKMERPYLEKSQTKVLLGEMTMVVTGKGKEIFADFYFREQKLELGVVEEILLQLFFEHSAENPPEKRFITVSKVDLRRAIDPKGEKKTALGSYFSSMRRAFEKVGCPYIIQSVSTKGYTLFW